MDVNTSIYDSEGRIAAVSCEFYKSERPNPPLSNKILTQYYCVQRSVFASKAGQKVFLCSQCFNEYHRLRYRQAIGSCNVKGLVIGKYDAFARNPNPRSFI